MSQLLRIAGFLGVAALVMAAPRATAVGCNDETSESGIPDEVEGEGLVTAVGRGTFTVGEVTFVRPASFHQLTWCNGAPEGDEDEEGDDSGMVWKIPRLRVGDYVGVGGSLRADGTVLAY